MTKNKVTREQILDFLRSEVEIWGEANVRGGVTDEPFRNGFRAGILHGLYAAIHEIEQGVL